jgi:hypothetical protein
MYILKNNQVNKVETTTFSELKMKENDLEDIIRKNIDMICDDDSSMIIVGQQVVNSQGARCDLVAMNNNGELDLIELKRDKKDSEARKEAFEFQAIRYAASFATIKTPSDLVQNVFAPYVEKHMEEFSNTTDLTSTEIAQRYLKDFMEKNNITDFNEHQGIILVAYDFDEQTLSAVAWLDQNNVDISCYKVCPYKVGEETVLQMQKVLPLDEYGEYYVDIISRNDGFKKIGCKNITRQSLPRIDSMLRWGVVKAGDCLEAKGTNNDVILQSDGTVKLANGEIVTLQQWLKDVYKWPSVATYMFAILKETGKTLSEIRETYMATHDDF